MWLITTMQPPVAGIFSPSIHVCVVATSKVGLRIDARDDERPSHASAASLRTRTPTQATRVDARRDVTLQQATRREWEDRRRCPTAPRPVPLVVARAGEAARRRQVAAGRPARRQRRDLAAAFALDTVAAACAPPACRAVLAVTDDAGFARELPRPVRGDPRRRHATSTPPCVRPRPRRSAAGRALSRSRCAPTCRLCGPRTCDERCRGADDRRAFVADAAGTGTTLYTAPSGAFEPQVRRRVGAAHVAAGALEIDGACPASAPTSTTSPTSTRPSRRAWARTPLRHRALAHRRASGQHEGGPPLG